MTTMQAILAVLKADPTLASLVGIKVFPSYLPQGTQGPAVVVRVISDVPESELDSDSSTDTVNVRVQVDSYAKNYDGAQKVGDAVKDVLTKLSAPDLSAWRVGGGDSYNSNDDLPHCASGDYSVWR